MTPCTPPQCFYETKRKGARDGYIYTFWLTIDLFLLPDTHSTWNRTDLESTPDSWRLPRSTGEAKDGGVGYMYAFWIGRDVSLLGHGVGEQDLGHCTARARPGS